MHGTKTYFAGMLFFAVIILCFADVAGAFISCNVTNPCMNGGTCKNQPPDYICICAGGWTGRNCSTNINECASKPCKNGGTCTDMVNGFSCRCSPGWEGPDCGRNINDCIPNPCKNGGSCTDLVNDFSCTCTAGYVGKECALNFDDCASRPCRNGGTCTDLVNNFSCKCTAGWEGKDCGRNIDDCASSPCRHGSTCTDLVNDFSCSCSPGWGGKDCGQDPAAITSHSNLTVRANENDMVTLECNVSGSPTPKVNWTRNGQQITGKQGQTYSFNAMESLSGNYSCVVSNGVGAVQRKTFAVKITGYCKNHKCRYGGTCRSKGVGYTCLCTRGLIGKFCEFEDPITAEFDCLLVIIDPDWVPQYGDKKSPEYNDLERKICSPMFKIFNGFNGNPPAIPGKRLVNCVLLIAIQGSIISNTLLTLNGSALKSEVLNAIQNSVINETIFGNLALKASSIQVEPKRDACSSEPCKFDGKCEVQGNGYRCECVSFRYGMHCEKGIGLIPGLITILACILIIIIIVILCVLYCKRKKSETYPTGAENGTQMKAYTFSDHNAAAANPHVTTADEKPPVRNGQPVETYRQRTSSDSR